MDEATQLVDRLLVQAQALSAVVAHLRLLSSDVPGDPAVNAELQRVIDALGAKSALDSLSPGERDVLANLAQSYLGQAVDLAHDPTRSGEWTLSDPEILQSQGTASGGVATLIAEADIGAPGMRILDVGTGVGGLAIAFCEMYPGSTVVGVDPWEPALSLARENIAEAGLEERITLIAGRLEDFVDPEGFDLIWVPSFFISEAVLDQALLRVYQATRPGGKVVMGIMGGSEDALAEAVDRLFTVRSGGSSMSVDEGMARLRRSGFDGVIEIEKTWQIPLRLVLASRT